MPPRRIGPGRTPSGMSPRRRGRGPRSRRRRSASGTAHEIVGDEPVGVSLAYQVGVEAIVLDDGIAGKACVRQQPRGVMLCRGRPRRIDFVEGAVLLAPERVPPRLVESVNITVPVREPRSERVGTIVAVTPDGLVTAELVVRLPAGDVRRVGVSLGDPLDDPKLSPRGRRRS